MANTPRGIVRPQYGHRMRAKVIDHVGEISTNLYLYRFPDYLAVELEQWGLANGCKSVKESAIEAIKRGIGYGNR